MKSLITMVVLIVRVSAYAQIADPPERTAGPAKPGPDVVLENQGCRLVIGADGEWQSFHDATLKEDRLMSRGRPFMSVRIGEQTVPATGVKRDGKLLTVYFGGGRAEAVIECDERPHFIGLLLKSWKPQDLDAITLVDLQLKKLENFGRSLKANYDDRTAVTLQTLRYWGDAHLWQHGETVTFRCTYNRKRGLAEAGCALIVCPRSRFLKTIQEMEETYGLPSPKLEGVWGKLSPAVRRSYLMPSDLNETNVDEVISYAKRGHFGYILLRGENWPRSNGTFAINERNFPHGLDGLKATIAKMKAAGFKVGLHFLCAGISRRDPLIAPIPDDGLFVDAEIALAGDLDEKIDFIPTMGPPTQFQTKKGSQAGMILRLDDELVEYTTLKLEPPFGFAGCTRGVCGTKPMSHKKAITVKHLKMAYNMFLIDADTDLLDRVSRNFANVFNYCDCDGLYFDGSEALQGNHRVYGTKIQMAYYEKLHNKDVIAQGSSWFPYTWHLMLRMASADGSRDIKGYLDKRSRNFAKNYFANFMPLDVGWYTPEWSSLNDLEYVCCRALEFMSSVSISASTKFLRTKKELRCLTSSPSMRTCGWRCLRE